MGVLDESSKSSISVKLFEMICSRAVAAGVEARFVRARRASKVGRSERGVVLSKKSVCESCGRSEMRGRMAEVIGSEDVKTREGLTEMSIRARA